MKFSVNNSKLANYAVGPVRFKNLHKMDTLVKFPALDPSKVKGTHRVEVTSEYKN